MKKDGTICSASLMMRLGKPEEKRSIADIIIISVGIVVVVSFLIGIASISIKYNSESLAKFSKNQQVQEKNDVELERGIEMLRKQKK